MPNYSYICKNCGHKLQVFQKITEEPLQKCPSCTKKDLKRSIGGKDVVLRFKGSGFYCNDYKKQKDTSCEGKCQGCDSSKP